MRSVWICSRNDVLGNVAVMPSGVFGTGPGWPDIIIASVMAALSLCGAGQIINRMAMPGHGLNSQWAFSVPFRPTMI